MVPGGVVTLRGPPLALVTASQLIMLGDCAVFPEQRFRALAPGAVQHIAHVFTGERRIGQRDAGKGTIKS